MKGRKERREKRREGGREEGKKEGKKEEKNNILIRLTCFIPPFVSDKNLAFVFFVFDTHKTTSFILFLNLSNIT